MVSNPSQCDTESFSTAHDLGYSMLAGIWMATDGMIFIPSVLQDLSMRTGLEFQPHFQPVPVVASQETPRRHTYRVIDEDLVDQALGSFLSGEYRIYVCNECSKQFGDLLNARLHVHKHWHTRQPLECIECNARFAQKASAQRHVDNREKRFSCCFCARSYARSDYLLAHKKKCARRVLA